MVFKKIGEESLYFVKTIRHKKPPPSIDEGGFLGFTTNKKSTYLTISAFQKKGDDILSHNNAVPSAQTGLTSLFGMERGEPRCYNRLKL